MEWQWRLTRIRPELFAALCREPLRPPATRSGFREKAAIFRSYNRRWRFRRRGVSLPFVKLPEQLPEILGQRMEKRVPWHRGTEETPFPRMLDQALPAGIVQHIKTGARKCATHAVPLPQNAVVGLFLQLELHAG